MKYQAFIFDMNGTMIDDMKFHIDAWHRIINSFGADLSWERVRAECYGKNNELLERVFPGRFSIAEMDAMSMDKEKAYQEAFLPQLKLLPGLEGVLKKAKEKGIGMAIGSAAIMFNIDFVLDGLQIRDYFTSIISADHVKVSKPDPQTFLRCAEELGVDPSECLVFEDAPKGVEAAANAGMDCVVLTTMHGVEEFSTYDNVVAWMKDYRLMNW